MHTETIALNQLRAAFVLWEIDVRANPGNFQTQDEYRIEPLKWAADGYIKVILEYIAKASNI
ncbi:hypothetical protein [Burkholderia pseudomallei]|uniref:hypothetical protein n=1 Tax=Burkholderia pseudomallei TaxID=28450 RepID=UPI0009764A7C|nr:hypothetical protein [Burkholderia pseudomallei]OMQ57087.1 hypothetical protein AQ709_26665 [Burkholderia pseudomallei]OMQ65153.1 hypothetical protein AQ712_13075 [Burkholderia pseudomallei]OMQ72884.1 hypothetical protein AQ711_02535 [Burkholderia pseudomallei]CAJ2715975.1 Uncharacterised protein [Burkholderia pseudomallei]CAJ4670497.1 Uncharacterised protein [Burkholderia pseudomallei]